MPDATPQRRGGASGDRGQLVRFPAARAPESPPRHNLPLQLTSFVGREREISDLEKVLAGGARLVTLTGPGGSGKTRLAIAAAQAAAEDFGDGVWWVDLAPISDPDLVPQAVARVLMVKEEPDQSLTETVARDLGSTELLLVLDNCEHLVGACATLADILLRSCPNLKILATSREALAVDGERSWPVYPLSSPEPGGFDDGELERFESVRLFVERARYRLPHFSLDAGNAEAVAEICRRLEGMPLAVELAAARVGTLSVAQISDRLERSLRLLASRDRTTPERQRTLRAALDWSYGLLDAEERGLFGRLSVFAGGFTLEAVEAVEEDGALEMLARLVEKSIVQVEEGEERRYRLLEPVRQYALERLEEFGEERAVRGSHARLFLQLAERAERELSGPEQASWLERLEVEHDNLRAAMAWSLDGGDAEVGLRLAGALGEFWHMRGHLSEGSRWLEATLENRQGSGIARAKALGKAGWIAWERGDYERSEALNAESLTLFRQLGDGAGAGQALYTLGLGEMHRGELERASELLEEAVTLNRSSRDTARLSLSLTALGMLAMVRQDNRRAVALHEEGLALAREAEDDFAINVSLMLGALVYLGEGEHRQAESLCEEGLRLSRRLRARHATATYLNVSATLAGAQGQPARAARLWGAAEQLLELIGAVLSPTERSYFGAHIASARARLEQSAWEEAWEEGRTMSSDLAIEYALEGRAKQQEDDAPTSSGAYPGGLSERETDVLKLVAQGLTNAQIARTLFISPNTVNRHLNSVYRKLGVSSRAAATRFAAEHDLA